MSIESQNIDTILSLKYLIPIKFSINTLLIFYEKRNIVLKLLNKASAAILIAFMVIGSGFWNRFTSYQDAKAEMLEFCGGNRACQVTSTDILNTCFDIHYRVNTERQKAGLDHAAFTQCMHSMEGNNLIMLNR